MADVTVTAHPLSRDGATHVVEADAFDADDVLLCPAIGRGGLLLVITSTEAEDAGTVTVRRTPARSGPDQTVDIDAEDTVALLLRESLEYGEPTLDVDFDGTIVAYPLSNIGG